MLFSYYDVLARAYRDAPTINATWPPIAAARGDHHPLDWGHANSSAYPSAAVLAAGGWLERALAVAQQHQAAAQAAAQAQAQAARQPAPFVERVMELRLEIMYLALQRWDALRAFAAAQHVRWPFGTPSKRQAFASFSEVLTASWGQAGCGWLGPSPLVIRKPACDLGCFEKQLFGVG
eukprot:COSAG01_NODE_1660_length_9588_cov_458.469175_10_plen_178_part_00